MKYAYIVIMIMLLSLSGCGFASTSKTIKHKNEKVYYQYMIQNIWGIHPSLEGEITEEDALSLEFYCIGFYNEKGQLYCLEEFIHSKLLHRTDYLYDAKGGINVEVRIGYVGQNDTEGGPHIIILDSNGEKIYDLLVPTLNLKDVVN